MTPHLEFLKADHEDIVNRIKASLADADKKTDEKDESGQKDELKDGESSVFTALTTEEIKARRESMDLAFFMTERSLREAAEREGR